MVTECEENAIAAVDGQCIDRVLPKDWKWVRLGDVSEVIAGQSPPGKSYNSARVGAEFHQGKVAFGDKTLMDSGKWTTESRRFAEPGDVVMSIRAPVGPVNLVDRSVAIGRGLASIRVNTRLLTADWLFHYMRNIESELTGTPGSTFASIRKSQIEEIPVPLAPLRDQRNVVLAVEDRLETVDRAKRSAVKQLEAAGTMAAAYLRSAFPKRGEKMPEGWGSVSLGELCEITIGKTPPRKDSRAWGGGHKWAKISDIQGDVVSSTSESLSDFGAAICGKRLLRKGTTMFSFKLTIGKTALAGSDLFANEAIAGLVPRNPRSLRSDYLMYVLRAIDVAASADNAVKGKTLNKSSMSRLVIPVPGIDSQKRIAVAIRRSQLMVADARQAARSQIDALGALKGAYLRLAFEGRM